MSEYNPSVSCTVCGSSALKLVLDFNEQPISNRYHENAGTEIDTALYPLALGSCLECKTIQLYRRMPVEEIRPRHAWISYNEPETHLDEVANTILGLSGINSSSKVLGISIKDQSTLDRLNRMASLQVSCFETFNPNEVLQPPYGLETILQVLENPEVLASVRETVGLVDVVLARHIIEHDHQSTELVKRLLTLVKPGGYLIFELPDSEKILNFRNYPFIWEEHITYFTEASLTELSKQSNAALFKLERYSYPYEDSLVAYFQRPTSEAQTIPKTQAASFVDATQQVEAFSDNFRLWKEEWRKRLEAVFVKHKKAVVFGAGHLAVRFINFLDIADRLECVIDDSPHKLGLYMPGSALPIRSSSTLSEPDVHLCISTLSPESELKVQAKIEAFKKKGGVWLPAFQSKQ